MSTPHHATLSNGIQIVLEPIPHRRSVALGVWMARGSRHEDVLENGMTHFCEHLLFKGTPSQGWKDIGRRMNRLGGNFNAMTSSEWVKLYGQVITRDVEEAMGLLSEMFLQPTFPKEEVDREREVILEEIAQYEDLPDELCGETLLAQLLLPHPLGRPVIGTDELVTGFTRDALSHYWGRSLEHDPLLVSMAGDLEIEPTIALCERLLSHLPTRPTHRLIEEPVTGGHGVALIDRDLEQVNFGLAMIGARRNSEDRFAWAVYDTILGGGMGSRLFDEIREKRGLAYSIGSGLNSMRETGMLQISCSTRPETAAQALEICLQEISKLADEGPTAEELSTSQRQLERSHLLAQESTGWRALVNGERLVYDLPHVTTEEILRRLHNVTAPEVRAVAERVKAYGAPAFCAVGSLKEAKGLEKMAYSMAG